MRKYPLLYTAFGLVVLLVVVHFIAAAFYFYWIFWWFDNLSHFLAGFSLGFFSLYIFYESGLLRDKLSLPQIIFLSFIFVMLLGGVWEIFEYINDLTQSTEEYSLDVVHDLLSDALGAILALLVAKRFLKPV